MFVCTGRQELFSVLAIIIKCAMMMIGLRKCASGSVWKGHSKHLLMTRCFSQGVHDVIVTHQRTSAINEIMATSPNINLLCDKELVQYAPFWGRFRHGVQVDGRELTKLRSIDPIMKLPIDLPNNILSSNFAEELRIALESVRLCSFVSRSMQRILLSPLYQVTSNNSKAIESKSDSSPVTIVDYACQALILELLHKRFTSDKFIAEEDSSTLRTNELLRDAVVRVLESATGDKWPVNRLYSGIDLGSSANQSDLSGRVWTVDPIDGTQGFLRGQHYCIALSLLDNGVPKLSVMGTPNFDSRWFCNKVVSRSGAHSCFDEVTPNDLHKVESFDMTNVFQKSGLIDEYWWPSRVSVHPSHVGLMFFAVMNEGAYCVPLCGSNSRRLSVQPTSTTQDLVFSESAEASHGDRLTSRSVLERLRVRSEFLRLDGQCKHCFVGGGLANAIMRLPPASYKEKIWDHVPGMLFVQEAGGIVSDLQGRPLLFKTGRYLDPSVSGVLTTGASVGTHQLILDAIQEVKSKGFGTS